MFCSLYLIIELNSLIPWDYTFNDMSKKSVLVFPFRNINLCLLVSGYEELRIFYDTIFTRVDEV
jgi:hypothetical protein